MIIQIDGEDILYIGDTHMKALEWRLVDPKEWIKRAIIGQIAHARDEMIEKETKRIRGKEEGMPESMSANDMIEWLSSQSTYRNAKERLEESVE